MMRLGSVLEGLVLANDSPRLSPPLSREDLALEVTGVTSDSRKVKKGSLFIALQGAMQGASADGHNFIHDAIQRGALLIIAEKPVDAARSVPVLRVKNGREALARCSCNFFQNPSRDLLVIGITGTSGKTTISYLVEALLMAAGHKVGVVGTINIRYPGTLIEASQTTPGSDELQAILAAMKSAGCTAVVMEVSSHALSQKRISEIAFDLVAFSNLSPEHQDYHSGMEDYYQAKKLLFSEHMVFSVAQGKKPQAVVHVGDLYGRRLSGECAAPVVPVSITSGRPDWPDWPNWPNWNATLEGIQGEYRGVPIHSPLIGSFNIENILVALGVASALEIDPQTCATGIAQLKNIPGRLERVSNKRGVHVFVDYAHKPDALEKVLLTLKGAMVAHSPPRPRLFTVFGCGGDRDRTKRPTMGRLAALHSDRVWVTSDNPRTEDPIRIIEEIVSGMDGFGNFRLQPDRNKAIEEALKSASPGDLVLIAGKGHETYQILPDPDCPGKTKKVPFDDRKVAAAAAAAAADDDDDDTDA